MEGSRRAEMRAGGRVRVKVRLRGKKGGEGEDKGHDAV